MPRVQALVAGFALVALALQAGAIHRQSLTGDEAHHLVAGQQALWYGQNLLNWEHPPLPKLVAALPSLWEAEPLAPPLRIDQALAAISRAHERPEQLWRLAARGRWLMLLVFAVPLIVACFALGRRFGGPRAGLVLAGFLALSFNVVPFLPLLLTDVPAALGFALTVLAALRWLEQPGTARAAVLGAALGLALVCKLSALLLGPAVVVALAIVPPATRSIARRLGDAAVIAGIALGVLLAAYGVANRSYDAEAGTATLATYVAGHGTLAVGDHLQDEAAVLHRIHARSPALGQWLLGVRGVAVQNEVGIYLGYAFGEVSSRGRWWYFPAVFFLKTPLVLLVAALALAAVAAPRASLRRLLSGTRPATLVVTVAAVTYLAAAITSSYNIGFRHLLPVLPFLLLPLAVILSRRPAAAVLVLGLLAGESLLLAPSWMSATNTWWLGEANPTRFALSHADLEYRQNFRLLAREATARGIADLRVIYPGLAPSVLRASLPEATLVGPGDPRRPDGTPSTCWSTRWFPPCSPATRPDLRLRGPAAARRRIRGSLAQGAPRRGSRVDRRHLSPLPSAGSGPRRLRGGGAG